MALQQDKPQIIEQNEAGTIWARHFEDGSVRMAIYAPDGSWRVVTNRTNASTGAEEHLIERSDGSSRRQITLPDGNVTTIETAADGSVETREEFVDEAGDKVVRTTTAEGVDLQVQSTLADGTIVNRRTFPDGQTEQTTTSRTENPDGSTRLDVVTIRGEEAQLVRRSVTVTQRDGSSVTTVSDDTGVTETITQSTMPDGATRLRVVHADGTDETTITREYHTKEGWLVKEISGEDNVRTIVTRDGSTSDTTKYDDGSMVAVDHTRMPDGSVVTTHTNRDGTWESITQSNKAPYTTMTTRSDGTRVLQTLDDERMTTVVQRPDGTRTEIRVDPDGAGSTGEYDASGVLQSVTTHDGEPLDRRRGLDMDDASAPAPGTDLGATAAPDTASDTEVADGSADAAPGDDVVAPAASSGTDVAPSLEEELLTPVGASNADPLDDDVLATGLVAPTGDDGLGAVAASPLLDVLEEDAPAIGDVPVEVDEAAEVVNVGYSVTELEDGTTIVPDPAAPPAETPFDNPLEQWEGDDVPVEVDEAAEVVNYAYTEPEPEPIGISVTVTETEGGEITPDPAVPSPPPDDTVYESY